MNNNYSLKGDMPDDPVKKPHVQATTDPTSPKSTPDPPEKHPVADPIPGSDPDREPSTEHPPNVLV